MDSSELAVWEYVKQEWAKKEMEIMRLEELLRQIGQERDTWKRAYLDQKHLYERDVHERGASDEGN